MSSEPIFKLVDSLPTSSVTVYMLQALDFVIPGQWKNVVGFEETIRVVSGETDQQWIQKIGDRAVALYNDRSQGYQRAVWLYQTIDKADAALATAALANKAGEKIGFLSFLSYLTPRPDKSQTLDLCLKLAGEVVAFCQVNGIPGDSIGDFVKSLADYSGEELMRMTALVCIDGIIPLGPDFASKALSTLDSLSSSELAKNETFQKIQTLIPGGNANEQLGFLQRSMGSVKDWMTSFVAERGLNADRITTSLKNVIEISDDKTDYLAAFLDMTTNYYEHTGIQTVARRLIRRAVSEI